MQEFLVSVEVYSKSSSLEDISSSLGVRCSAGSKNRGDASAFGAPYPHTAWRLKANALKDRKLASQIKRLLSTLPIKKLSRQLKSHPDWKVCFRVGVLFDAANAALTIPSDVLGRIAAIPAEIDFSAYPSHFGGNARVRGKAGKAQGSELNVKQP